MRPYTIRKNSFLDKAITAAGLVLFLALFALANAI